MPTTIRQRVQPLDPQRTRDMGLLRLVPHHSQLDTPAAQDPVSSNTADWHSVTAPGRVSHLQRVTLWGLAAT